jgi:hypothetical protein
MWTKNKRKEYMQEYRSENPDKVKELNKKWREKYYPKHKKEIQKNYKKWAKKKPERKKYFQYRYSSKQRKREFLLTQEQFAEILRKKCHYCGSESNIGIDRINNNKGYMNGNVVPCCRKCNYMKFTMTQKEFIDQCKKIVNYSRRIPNRKPR